MSTYDPEDTPAAKALLHQIFGNEHERAEVAEVAEPAEPAKASLMHAQVPDTVEGILAQVDQAIVALREES